MNAANAIFVAYRGVRRAQARQSWQRRFNLGGAVHEVTAVPADR
jgi:hypothetical protein